MNKQLTPPRPLRPISFPEPKRRLTPPESTAPVSSPIGSNMAALVALPARLFLGLGWLRAGVEKLINPDWWDGSALRSFLEAQQAEQLPFMGPIVDHLIEPTALFIGLGVLVAQLVIGVLFLTGRRLPLAVGVGMTLNITFIAMGAVSPSAFYLVLELVVLTSLAATHTAAMRNEGAHRLRLIALLAASGLLLPFTMTLQPGGVIHDPAVMLITFFLLAALMETVTMPNPGPIVTRMRELLLQSPQS